MYEYKILNHQRFVIFNIIKLKYDGHIFISQEATKYNPLITPLTKLYSESWYCFNHKTHNLPQQHYLQATSQLRSLRATQHNVT